jgi:hypothetical protein
MTRKQRRLTMIGGSLAVLAVAAAAPQADPSAPQADRVAPQANSGALP